MNCNLKRCNGNTNVRKTIVKRGINVVVIFFFFVKCDFSKKLCSMFMDSGGTARGAQQ